MDISKFFDTIEHEKLLIAVERHMQTPWLLLYIRRWLRVPYERSSGELVQRDRGVAQGSVIGPLLANLYLHYVFDKWMEI
jgi:retron-type reverse transcriptase